ncbi:MAG TPA: AMP-binding protein [Acidimicrobiales bacterium]|nr:AMP-binding protein [Acidimicrobiales bacterium]
MIRAAMDRVRIAGAHDLTLGTLLERLTHIHGPRTLMTTADERLSFSQAADRVERWAGTIHAEVTGGSRVVLILDGYDLLLASLAVSRAGALPVPINSQMRDEEIDHVVSDAGAAMVVRDPIELSRGGTRLARSIPARPSDIAALFYTSGTTGKPKGVELTHRGLLGTMGAATLFPNDLRRDEAVIALPVAHIYGFTALLGLAAAGVPVHYFPRFRADMVLDAIEQRRATIFMGVPAMYRLMAEAGAERRDLKSVRVWASGADVMPDDLARRFQKMGASATLPLVGSVGDALFVEGYGMVELGGGVALKVGSNLLAMPGYRFKVVDDDGREVSVGQVGELWVSGPGTLRGYYGDAKATADALTSDGWVRTGDLARRGLGNTVRFAGRKKDVIKHGGYSVYAVEVEAALTEHPDILEAAVVGLPDPRKGEVPVAAVRVRDGSTATPSELVAWATEHLSDYKAPRQVVIVDELPRTGTTKVRKRGLIDLFESRG